MVSVARYEAKYAAQSGGCILGFVTATGNTVGKSISSVFKVQSSFLWGFVSMYVYTINYGLMQELLLFKVL